MQHEPYIQYTDAVVPPRDERREEWWIFARLEQQLGFKSVLDGDGDGAPSRFGRLDHKMRGVGVSTEELAARPDGTAVLPPLDPGRFYDDWIQTEDQRVDCCPAIFEESRALARAEQIFVELAAEPAGTLKLITRRDARMHNSWYQNVERLRRGKDGRNPLYIHPSDAAARGLEERARARLSNEVGAIDVELAFDPGLARGVVAMAHGGGNGESTGMQVARRYPGANPNALLPRGPGSFEPLSNQAFMTGIPVSLDALAQGSSE
jgi:anaerobic selenocysteine-containing dehydrogenase